MDAQKNALPHPDENLLVAFVEQGLTQSERQFVVEHLAVCLRCREITFLAKEAAPEHSAPAEVQRGRSLRESLTASRSAFSWAWVYVAVAVVIAVVLSFLAFRGRHQLTAIQAVRTTAPKDLSTAAASSEVATGALSNSSTTTAHDTERFSEASASGASKSRQPRATRSPGTKTDRFAEAHSLYRRMPQSQLETGNGTSALVPSNASAGTLIGGVSRAPSMPLASLSAPLVKSELQSVSVSPTAHTAVHPQPLASPGLLRANHLATGAGLTTSFKVDTGVVERCRATVCTPVPLPAEASSAMSTAFFGNTVMVLDTSGHLYVSDDQGDHWENVASQWTETARSLQLTGASGFAGSTAQSAFTGNSQLNEHDQGNYSKDSPEHLRSPTFELTNDHGQIWQSSDRGLTWTIKKAP